MNHLPFFAALYSLLVFLLLISPALHSQNTQRLLPDALSGWRADAGAHAATLEALKMSIEQYDGKRYTEALAALAGVGNAEKTQFGDYILFYRAKASLELKRYAEALEYFRLLEKHFPDSSKLREAVMGQCQALLELKESATARSLLGKYRQYTGVEPMYYEARALHLEEKKEEAIALYLQVYAKYPSSSFSSPSYDHILALSPNAFSGARNYLIRLERAENRIREKDYSSARTLLAALGQVSAPDNKTGQRRNLLRAEVEYNQNRTTAALTILESFKTDDPDMHARALYLEGASRRRLKQETAFIALRDRALKLYPRSSDTEELCNSVATYFDVNYEQRKARDAYRILLQAFPKGSYAERAQWKVALAAWFEGKHAEAVREFRDYIIANPGPASAGSGMYWMGRSYAKLGAAEEARYLYRRARALAGDGYYGLRAREAEEDLKNVQGGAGSGVSGIDFKEIRALCDGIQLPDAEAIADPDASGIMILRRAGQLAAAGLESLAVAELRWSIEQYPQNRRALQYVIAKISASRGGFYDSISTLRRVFPDYNNLARTDLPEDVWDLFFPTRFSDIVAKHAKNAGLDTALILGLIRQESAFNPRARSSANARGLMQLLPATALETAASAKVTRAQAQAGNLYDPEINIRLGIAYFNAMLKRHGRPELALAAYNAGGSRVTRWVQEYGGDDMAWFVEQIPFTETRNYVKTVLGNAAHYRRLLPARGL
jgi:soluble lytic murein transglycosylase